MYLPKETEQAKVFSGMFQDWERGDLEVVDPAGAKKLLQICAKVQKEENWYSDGITCVATANFPKTRRCGVCKDKFKAGVCGVKALCSSHASHDRCFGTRAECVLCKENN
jgi:hypothetical protein